METCLASNTATHPHGGHERYTIIIVMLPSPLLVHETIAQHARKSGLSPRRTYCVVVLAVCLLILWPMGVMAAELSELEEIIDEARLTFVRFTGHPSMKWFRERAQDAHAVFIAPQVTRGGYLFGGAWGTGVLLLRDPSTGQWSEPAFYRLAGISFGLQVGALTSEIVAMATDDQAAAKMGSGAFTLGFSGSLGAGRRGGGISGSIETTSGTGFVTVSTTNGLYAGVAVGGTLVISRAGANELYYGQPIELNDLREHRVRQWYSERLIQAIASVTTSGQEPSP